MTDWRSYLTDDETARLAEIKEQKRELSKEARRLFDRARKRAARA